MGWQVEILTPLPSLDKGLQTQSQTCQPYVEETVSFSYGDDYFLGLIIMAETKTVFYNLRNDREAPT